MLPPRVKVTWRTKGGKMPEGVVLCGRPGKYSNPFKVGESFTCDYPGAQTIQIPDAETACKFFRVYANEKLKSDPAWLDPLFLATGLACPGCDPEDQHCHLAVIHDLMRERLAPVESTGQDSCASSDVTSDSGHGEQQTEQGLGQDRPAERAAG